MKKLMMNKIALYVLIISCCSCKKLTEFNISDSSSFVVPQTAVIGAPLPGSMQFSNSATYQFQSNGTDSKHVKEIRLEEVTLTVTDPPSGQTFSFLNSIHIFISASGLPEKELAYLDNIPSSVGSSIGLNTTGEELSAYIKKGDY